GYIFTSPAQRAGEFFSSSGGPLTAASFSLNAAIEQDPNRIASSLRVIPGTVATGDQVVKGNNTLALLMSGLRDKMFTFNPISSNNGITKGTFDDYYRGMLGQLGV